MEALKGPVLVDVDVSKLMGSESFSGGARKLERPSVAIAPSIGRISGSVRRKEQAFWSKMPQNEFAGQQSRHHVEDASEDHSVGKTSTVLPLTLGLEAAQSHRNCGKVGRNSTSNSKRSRIMQMDAPVNKTGEDGKGLSTEISANLTNCKNGERAQMLKQRQNYSGKRSDKRNGKVTKSNFSLKSLVGFGSATGGRNFLGMYGLKSDVMDVTKDVDDLPLRELLDGTYKCVPSPKDRRNNASNSSDSLMQLISNANSVLRCQKSVQMQHCSNVDSKLSCRNDGDKVETRTDNLSSSDQVQEYSSKVHSVPTMCHAPLYTPKDVLERLALAPSKDLDSLLADTVKFASSRNSSDLRLSKPSSQRNGLPPFSWSHPCSGHPKTVPDSAKLSTNKMVCQGRWVRVENTSTSLKGSTGFLEELQALTDIHKLVPTGVQVSVMMSGDNEEPVPKRQRREDGVAVEVRDPMQAMREKLGRVSDPHLQARLLLDFSALALAPHAKTEDAVDFLFAFLQQNQSMPSGDQEKRATNAESSSSAAGNSNAVVIAAIVRGLRDLLAIKPKVVEPMIQVDAMGEQLTQCVSVADDFKLRANMLHIVVDCLLSAEKLTDAETLLNACVQDHDDGVRWICLEGYSRLLKKQYQFGEEVVSVLIDRLVDMTANDTSERTRSLAARLLGALMATLGESPLYEDLKALFVNSVAAMVRDSSAKVRRSVAISLRQLGDTSEQMWAPLLQKQQIVEDLGEVETLSVTMLNSGAVLNLLEDENAEVAREASTSIRKIVEAASWGEELVAKAVESHIDLVIRFSKEPGLLDVLKNLGAVVTKWHAVSSSCYPLHLEKLSHILEVLPTTSAVGSELVGLCRHVAVNHDVAAAKIVKFLIRCSQFEMSDQTSDRKPLPDSTHASMTHIVEDWCKHGVRLEASTISSLRLIASSHTPRTLTECCAVLCNAFCAPEDREVGATRASSQKRMPSFLRGRIGPAPAHTMNEASRPSRVISSDLIGQIMVAVQRLQAQLREDVKTPKGCDARAPMCSNLFHLCCALYARTSFPERSHAERVLLKLVWLAVLGCSTDPTALQKEASQLPDAKSDPMLSPFLSSRPYREDDLDATLLQSLAGFRAQDLLDGVAEGHFNRLAIGSILEPSKVGPNEAIEVSSQLPFTLLVRCVMHYPPTNGDVFIKIQLPDGEDHFCPLNTVNASADRVEAETTISVQLPSFSDPTYVSLSVCIRAPKSLPQVEASRYYDISPVTKILVCHRTVPLRQSTNRGH